MNVLAKQQRINIFFFLMRKKDRDREYRLFFVSLIAMWRERERKGRQKKRVLQENIYHHSMRWCRCFLQLVRSNDEHCKQEYWWMTTAIFFVFLCLFSCSSILIYICIDCLVVWIFLEKTRSFGFLRFYAAQLVVSILVQIYHLQDKSSLLYYD